jgi:hypothetical protein
MLFSVFPVSGASIFSICADLGRLELGLDSVPRCVIGRRDGAARDAPGA